MQFTRTNEAAQNRHRPVIVDTQISFGFNLVVHSATKYISGHSDLVGGVAVAAEHELADRLGFLQNAVDAIAGPFDSFLALRGLKTLHLHMERHSLERCQILALAESLGRS